MGNDQGIKLYDYIDAIKALPAGTLTKGDLLVPSFRLYSIDKVDIYYAPFESINSEAQVVFVGITPGFTQMEIAYRVVRDGLLRGDSVEVSLQRVKQQASFAGTMRTNLVQMLDDIGLAHRLGVSTTESLFGDNRKFLHSTSVLRYPVFVDGENYTGHKPSLLRTPVFPQYIDEYFRHEVLHLQQALFVPMGKAVSDVLQIFVSEAVLQEEQCLMGFPHPSGANGHRKKQYENRKSEFASKVGAWYRPK